MTREIDQKSAKQGDNSRWTLTIMVVSICAALAVWLGSEFYYNEVIDSPASNSAVNQNVNPGEGNT